jgi:hypothetical protein
MDPEALVAGSLILPHCPCSHPRRFGLVSYTLGASVCRRGTVLLNVRQRQTRSWLQTPTGCSTNFAGQLISLASAKDSLEVGFRSKDGAGPNDSRSVLSVGRKRSQTIRKTRAHKGILESGD